MSKEGYLISHDAGKRSSICYCVLGEGKFSFYSRRDNGILLKEVTLSKSKIKVKGTSDIEARDCPYSFSVTLQRSKIRDGRLIVFGPIMHLVLSAPSWKERKLWGNAIHSWQRNYWGEPQHRVMYTDMTEDEIDEFFQAQLHTLQKVAENAMCLPMSEKNSTKTKINKIKIKKRSKSFTESEKSDVQDKKRSSSVSSVFSSRLNVLKPVKKMGNRVRQQLQSTTISISIPIGLNLTSAHPQRQTAAS